MKLEFVSIKNSLDVVVRLLKLSEVILVILEEVMPHIMIRNETAEQESCLCADLNRFIILAHKFS